MAMIQGIDGSALLQAFRQGREDKFNDQLNSLKITEATRDARNAQEFDGLAAQYYGGGSGGVAGNYAPPNPQAQLPVAAQPQSFGTPSVGALATGGAPAAAPPATAPVAADPYSAFPQITPANRAQWDKRRDGSDKGDGWLGVRQRPDGSVSSEISVSFSDVLGGREIPLMVPGLTPDELHYLMTTPPTEGMPIPQSIKQKAIAFAQQRVAQGKSPFRQPGEPSALDAPSASPGAPANLLPASATPASPGGTNDPATFNRMAVLDAERAGKIASALKDQSETAIKQHQAKNDIMGAAAHFIQFDERGQINSQQEQLARFDHAVPQLMAAGWNQSEIAGARQELQNPDPAVRARVLGGYQAVASDYDKLMDRELKEREFQQGKTVPVTAGGNVAIIMPDGSARWAIGGGGASAGLPHISSPQEAAKLKPGSHFIDPNGVIRTVPGGQTGAPSGTFHPVSNAKAIIGQLFPGVHVTDWERDPNSALGQANPGSWHNHSGAAVDVRPIPGMTFDQYVGRIRSEGYNIIEAIDEVNHPSAHATGPHWHIVIGEG